MPHIRIRISFIVLAALIAMLAGCKSQEQTVEEHRQIITTYSNAARDAGLEVNGYIEVPLAVGMVQTIEFGSRGKLVLMLRSNWNKGSDKTDETEPE